jgi:hypothetical protein
MQYNEDTRILKIYFEGLKKVTKPLSEICVSADVGSKHLFNTSLERWS